VVATNDVFHRDHRVVGGTPGDREGRQQRTQHEPGLRLQCPRCVQT
jgi:hypothetical protein